VSTFISNHVSWTDIIVFINQYQPAFAAKKELGNIPVFGLLCKALGCIFISRSASKDVRDSTIQQIGER
jgi:1-acyl-sn-glycerol-3-phosphate acyltransferase